MGRPGVTPAGAAWAGKGAAAAMAKTQPATKPQARARSRCCRTNAATQHRTHDIRAVAAAAARRSTPAKGRALPAACGAAAAEAAASARTRDDERDGAPTANRAGWGLRGAASLTC